MSIEELISDMHRIVAIEEMLSTIYKIKKIKQELSDILKKSSEKLNPWEGILLLSHKDMQTIMDPPNEYREITYLLTSMDLVKVDIKYFETNAQKSGELKKQEETSMELDEFIKMFIEPDTLKPIDEYDKIWYVVNILENLKKYFSGEKLDYFKRNPKETLNFLIKYLAKKDGNNCSGT